MCVDDAAHYWVRPWWGPEQGKWINLAPRNEENQLGQPSTDYAKNVDGNTVTVTFGPVAPPPSSISLFPALILIAIFLIGFSCILRPILGQNANGLILVAVGLIGLVILLGGRLGCPGFLVLLFLILAFFRMGLKGLFQVRS